MEPDYEGMAVDWLDTAGMSIDETTRAIARAQVYATLAVAQASRDLGIELRDIKDRLETIGNQLYGIRNKHEGR